MANYNIENIGCGALFPIKLSDKTKVTKVVTYDEETQQYHEEEVVEVVKGWYPVSGDTNLIVNNIRSILLYDIGQRFRQEDFGTKLISVIEEPNNAILTFLISQYIKEALYKYESRVNIKSLKAFRESYKINILLEITVIGINQEIPMEISYNIQ